MMADKQSLKIACIVFGAMGHFMPISNCATALKEKGHEVHIITNGNDYMRQKGKIYAERFGIIMDHTGDTLDPDEEFRRKPDGMEGVFESFAKKWDPYVMETIEKLRPDIIVCDFFSYPGVHAAKKFDIPFVMNVPGPFKILEEFLCFEVPAMKNAYNCCGMVCFKRGCFACLSRMVEKHFAKYQGKVALECTYDEVWMINSFFGLEKPVCLPPNFKLIGPLGKPQDKLLELLKEKDSELSDWLNQAHQNGEDVVYITLGTVCEWQPWSINVMHNGLKDLGCKVVWSLKDKCIPLFEETPNPEQFWVRHWIPQIEVLAHPAVKAGLSHCGWGGTLEFVGQGVPVVTWPHFADQPGNSELLCDQKVGVCLHTRTKTEELTNIDMAKMTTYLNPVFDYKKVSECFTKVLKDPIYAQNMQRLQAMAGMTNGRRDVVTIVE